MTDSEYRKLTARRVNHEWSVCFLDAFGDIQERVEVESFEAALAERPSDQLVASLSVVKDIAQPVGVQHIEIVLRRLSGSEANGIEDIEEAVYDRIHAVLPDRYDGGSKVPKRYLDEVERVNRKGS